MTTKMDSADLAAIRQSALGAADPLGVAAELAGAVDAGRLADPADAGYALTLAAEIAESRSKLDAALRYAERAVGAYVGDDDTRAGAARALYARILFRTGRSDEATAELEPLRPLLTRFPDAAAYLSAALAAGGQTRLAEEWLTEAVQTVLAERAEAGGGAAEPATADDAGVLFFLLQQRHRVRHALGRQHDTHDNLAERLETRLAAPAAAAAAGPADLLFWGRPGFDRLLATWPGLAEVYGADFDEHRAQLEGRLVQLAADGGTGLGLLPATVEGLTRQAGPDGDPADPAIRSAYARALTAAPDRIGWPPERNGPCWCGSGQKYKKCCLPRARG